MSLAEFLLSSAGARKRMYSCALLNSMENKLLIAVCRPPGIRWLTCASLLGAVWGRILCVRHQSPRLSDAQFKVCRSRGAQGSNIGFSLPPRFGEGQAGLGNCCLGSPQDIAWHQSQMKQEELNKPFEGGRCVLAWHWPVLAGS